MKTYKEMSRQELGEAYDNTSAVKNSSEILAIYEEKSKYVRENFPFVNMKYGEKERQNIDYFHVKDNAGVFVFIHGGYWQMRCKETFHFLVEIIAKQGLNLAFIGYTLAPENNIAGIEKELSDGLKMLRDKAVELKFDKDDIVLSGWSAGGHLSVELSNESGVKSVLAISGIYDLDPISMCFLNDKLSLSASDIKELSPIYKKLFSTKINLAYGEGELSEIIRQSKEFYTHLDAENASIKQIKGANHFTILLDEETFANLK